MNLSILIPALNEEKTIGLLLDDIPKKIEGIEKVFVIVVNDGSTDKTSKIARSKGAIVIDHLVNLGLGRSFQDGLAKSLLLKADIMVTIDADRQFNPREIPKLIEPIVKGEAHFVTGSRFVDSKFIPENMPKMKQIGNKYFAKLVSWAVGQRFYDVSCGFRAYGIEAMLQLNLFGKFTYTQETFLSLAYKKVPIKEVPVTVEYFDDRQSRVASSLISYGFRALNIIFLTIKDYKPLRFFGISGILIFIIGLALDIFMFAHFFKTGSFTPYKVIGFLAVFLNAIGIMIIFIGILADLIDKIRLTQEKILYYAKKEEYEKN